MKYLFYLHKIRIYKVTFLLDIKKIFFHIYLHFWSFLDEHGFLKRILSTKKVQCFTVNISVSSVYTTWLRSDLAKWFNLWLKMLYALYLYIIYYRKYLKYRYLGSFDVNCQHFMK